MRLRDVIGICWVLSGIVVPPAWGIPCEVYPVPPETHTGSGYTAVQCGSDGRVYLGTTFNGGSAHLVRFDPATKKWDDLFNAHQATRELGVGLDAQAKFHARLLVDADGTVWAATKQGNEDFTNRPEYGESRSGYPGGHLFSYDPKTSAVVDHGILLKQEGLLGGAIDRVRKRLYYVSDPKGHFLIYDIATNRVRDLGTIGPAVRYLALDANGRVFGPGGVLPGQDTPSLFMYDPTTDKLSQLAVMLTGLAADYRTPYVLVPNAAGNRLFGCAIGGKYVMDFDLNTIMLDDKTPLANGSILCRHPAAVTPPGDQHAGTLGQDGCFYFPNDGKLMRYDPTHKRVDDLGAIEVPDGGRLGNPQGACVGPDGTLYLQYIIPYQLLVFPKLTVPGGEK